MIVLVLDTNIIIRLNLILIIKTIINTIILDKLPKSQQAQAKQIIDNIYMATSREEAESSWKKFILAYSAKYPTTTTKATECLFKNEKELLAFYYFPAQHWIDWRATSPLEYNFATVKHRTSKSSNCF